MANDFYFTNEEIDDIASDCFMVLDEVNDAFDEEEDGEVKSEDENQTLKDPADIKLNYNNTNTTATETVDLTEEDEEDDDKLSQNEREHPYLNIVESYEVTEKQMRTEKFDIPPDASSTPLHVIDSVMHLMKIIKTLKGAEEIAIHLQNYMGSYENVICLLGLSTKDADYVIDAIKLKGELLLLTEIFTDPKIVKIVYDAETVLSLLQQCLHLFVINIFDVEKAAEMNLGRKPPSSPYSIINLVCEHRCPSTNIKDFRQRPVLDIMKSVARFAPHFMIHLYRYYKNELLEKPGDVYKNFLKDCRNICKVAYPERKVLLLQQMKEDLKVIQKCQCELVERVYEWRDETAKRLDKNPNAILSKALALRLAVQLTTNANEAATFVGSVYVKYDAKKIAKMAHEVREKYKITRRKMRTRKYHYLKMDNGNETPQPAKRKPDDQPSPNSNKKKNNIPNKPVNNIQIQPPPVNKKIKYNLRSTSPFVKKPQNPPMVNKPTTSQGYWQPALPTNNPVTTASPEIEGLIKLSQILSSSLLNPVINNSKILNPMNMPSNDAFQNKTQLGNVVLPPPVPPPPIIPPQLLDRVGVNHSKLNNLNCDTQELNKYLSTLTNEREDSRRKSLFSPPSKNESGRFDRRNNSLNDIDQRIESLEREFRPRDSSNSNFRSNSRWNRQDSSNESQSWKKKY